MPKLEHDDEDGNENEDEESRDVRRPREFVCRALLTVERLWDRSVQHETSLSDSEDEGTGGRKHRQNHKDAEGKRRSRSRSKEVVVAVANPGLASGSLAPPAGDVEMVPADGA